MPQTDIVPRWFALLIAMTLAMGGCGTAENATPAANTSGTPAKERVTLMLNWFPEAEHGGFYAALVHGYFEEEGLDVVIEPGGPKAPVMQNVADGVMHFGIDNADKLLLARAQQADVVAVLAPITDSPRCIMVREDSAVKTLADLATQKSFKLAMNTGQPFAAFLQQKVDLSNVQIVPYSGSLASFLVEENYGQQAYSFSEPFVAAGKGVKTRELMISDLGFNTYTSLLVVGRKILDEKPELVRKVVRASQRGWQKYLSDPEETNEFIHSENPEMALDVLEFGVGVLRPLCPPAENSPETWGEMSAERWDTLVRQMEESASLEPGKVTAAQAWSNEFLKAPASQEKTP
jgi:NitT/TauT family transport system substrate-binding protein